MVVPLPLALLHQAVAMLVLTVATRACRDSSRRNACASRAIAAPALN